MEEPARVRALAELFDYLGHQNARKQEAGELDNVDKDVVFSVEDEVGYEVERDLLRNFADKEEDIRKEEHEQGTVLEQERKAFLDARRVRLMLRTLAGVAVGQARENDYEHRGDYRGGQISLRGVILEIGEQSRASNKDLWQRADYGADDGADSEQLSSLDSARGYRKCQSTHRDVKRRVGDIEHDEKEGRINDVENRVSVRAADEEQHHDERNEQRSPSDIRAHLTVLRPRLVNDNAHHRVVYRVEDAAEKPDF